MWTRSHSACMPLMLATVRRNAASAAAGQGAGRTAQMVAAHAVAAAGVAGHLAALLPAVECLPREPAGAPAAMLWGVTYVLSRMSCWFPA